MAGPSPIALNGQRTSGLRFADTRVHPLWHALILFRLVANGFRSADLRNHLAALSGRTPEMIGHGAMTYQLRRLRLRGMIERIPCSHRYRVTDAGFRTALFFIRSYNRLLRPALAAILPDHHAARTLIERSFDTLDRPIAAWLADNQLGQSNLTHSRQISFLKQT